jgi:PKD repeat protein
LTWPLQAHGTATPCNVNVSHGGVTLSATAVTNVDWDWGDGTPLQTIANSPLAQHSYAQAGNFNLSATVTATTVDGPKQATVVKAVAIQ